MRAVVDTNVIAYLLLGTEPWRQECEEFFRQVEDPIAPASWEIELANVLWLATRKNVIDLAGAVDRLEGAKSLRIRSVTVSNLWRGALVRSHDTKVAVYDTVFVELAMRQGIALATFDGPLIKAFPDVACNPSCIGQ